MIPAPPAVRASLSWDTVADIDLYAFNPHAYSPLDPLYFLSLGSQFGDGAVHSGDIAPSGPETVTEATYGLPELYTYFACRYAGDEASIPVTHLSFTGSAVSGEHFDTELDFAGAPGNSVYLPTPDAATAPADEAAKMDQLCPEVP